MKMKNIKNRILSLLLASTLLISMFAVPVSGFDPENDFDLESEIVLDSDDDLENEPDLGSDDDLEDNFQPIESASVLSTSAGLYFDIVSLKVNALDDPLGIDDPKPDFSWAMESKMVAHHQSAYRIEVAKDRSFGSKVWDTGVINDSTSVGVVYGGQVLAPETDYWWRVTVTDNLGTSIVSETARFSTGLVMGIENASKIRDAIKPEWDNAEFIGSLEENFNAGGITMFNFDTRFQIVEGTTFSVIMGANDPRLTNPSMNPYGTAGGESFIRFEVDIGPIVRGTGTQAIFNVYRIGYHWTDTLGGIDPNKVPWKSMPIPTANMATAAVRDAHTLRIGCTQHTVSISLGTAANGTSMAAAYTVANAATAGWDTSTQVNNFATNRSHFDSNRRQGWNNHNVSPLTSINVSGAISTNTGHNFWCFPYLYEIGYQVNTGDKVNILWSRVTENGGQAGNPVKFSTDAASSHDRDAGKYAGFEGMTINADRTMTLAGNAANSGVPQYVDPSHTSLNYVRSDFTVANKAIEDAKLYVTALGGYEIHINGKRVGDDYLNPGSTVFRHTLSYNTYDIADMIKPGGNGIGGILNEGFWSGYISFTTGNRDFWGSKQGLLAKIVVKYIDGTKDTFVTNKTDWKVSNDGPVRYASLFQGEVYDARKEANLIDNGISWAEYGFDDSAWRTPDPITSRLASIDGSIIAKRDRPVRPVRNGILTENGSAKTDANGRVTATRAIEARNNADNAQGYVVDHSAYIYDMGNTLSMVPSVVIPAGWLKEGDVVILRNSELIFPGNEYALGFRNHFDDYNMTHHPDGYSYASLYGPFGTFHRNAAGKLQPDINRMTQNQDYYIASKADETRDVRIEPQHTYRSYRFLQVWIPGATQALPLSNVQSLVLSSDVAQEGLYVAESTDNTGAMVTQLAKNIHSGQLGNVFSIPTDCAQRNERQGWTGDAQAYVRTSTYFTNVQGFFRQWMKALRDDQDNVNTTTWHGSIGNAVPRQSTSNSHGSYGGTAWEAAVVQVPYQIWNQFGDLKIVEDSFQAIMDWLAVMHRYKLGGTNTILDHGVRFEWLSSKTTGHGDWVPRDGNTPQDVANNATYIEMLQKAITMARAIGKDVEADMLQNRVDNVIREYNLAYVDPRTGYTRRLGNTSIAQNAAWSSVARTANNYFIDSQASYAIGVNYDIFADDMFVTEGRFEGLSYKEAAIRRLAELAADPDKSNNNNPVAAVRGAPPFSITTGFSTTPNMLPGLTSNGRTEAAYAMVACKEYASWLYPITLGATTQWERWNSYELAMGWGAPNSMNSFNHFALGSMAEWLYEYSLGIQSNDRKGYKDFILQPIAGGTFTKLTGNYDSNYGNIESTWTARGNGKANTLGETVEINEMTSYACTVPANTTATLYLPVENVGTVTPLPGVVHKGTTTRNGLTVEEFRLLSGGYEFEISATGDIDIFLAPDYYFAPITSIKIDTLSITTIARGETRSFPLHLNDGASGKNVVWTIADPSLGYVDADGAVTIFDKTGNVRLTATDPISGLTHSITLRIAS